MTSRLSDHGEGYQVGDYLQAGMMKNSKSRALVSIPPLYHGERTLNNSPEVVTELVGVAEVIETVSSNDAETPVGNPIEKEVPYKE